MSAERRAGNGIISPVRKNVSDNKFKPYATTFPSTRVQKASFLTAGHLSAHSHDLIGSQVALRIALIGQSVLQA